MAIDLDPMCEAGLLRQERCMPCSCIEPECMACADTGYESISSGGYELRLCECQEIKPNNQVRDNGR
jgi:hypothetical protein